MADNYIQFAVEVEDLTNDEIAWLTDSLRWEPAGPSDEAPPWWDEGAESVGFSHEIDRRERSILIYSEEYGVPGCAAELLFAFVTKFRPYAIYTIEWAETCSRARPGQFGGGALVISRERIRWHGAGEWAAQERKKIEAWRAAEAEDKDMREGPHPDGVDVAQQRLRVAEAARGYCDGDGSLYGDARSLLEDILVDTHQTLDRETPAVLDRVVGAALDKHAFDIPEETEDGA